MMDFGCGCMAVSVTKTMIDQSIMNGDFAIAKQPIVNVGYEEVVGYSYLLRQKIESADFLYSPCSIIRQAENHHCMSSIDIHVAKLVAKEMDGLFSEFCGFNVSPQSISCNAFTAELIEIYSQWVGPDVIIEITGNGDALNGSDFVNYEMNVKKIARSGFKPAIKRQLVYE